MLRFLLWFGGILLGLAAFLFFGYAIPWRLLEGIGHPISRLPRPLLVLVLPLSVPLLPFIVAAYNRRTHPVQARVIEWLYSILYVLVGLIILIYLTSD